jgi:hypothetical protein
MEKKKTTATLVDFGLHLDLWKFSIPAKTSVDSLGC